MLCILEPFFNFIFYASFIYCKAGYLNRWNGDFFLEFHDTLNLLIRRVGSKESREREMIRPSEI